MTTDTSHDKSPNDGERKPPAKSTVDAFRKAFEHMERHEREAAQTELRNMLATRDQDPPWREMYAVAGFATLFGRESRVFEAITLARAATERALDMGDPHRALGTHLHYVMMLINMAPELPHTEALARLRSLLRQIGPGAPHLPMEEIEVIHASHALAQGDAEMARAHIERLEATTTRDVEGWRRPLCEHRLRAGLAILEGDAEAAFRELDAAVPFAERCPAERMRLVQVRLDAARGHADAALRATEARHGLQVLRQASDDPGLTSCCIDLARSLLLVQESLAEESGGDTEELWRETVDRMVSAIFARMSQLHRALEFLPDLGLGDLVQPVELIALRKRFKSEQEAVLVRLGQRLTDRRNIPPEVAADVVSGWIRVCSWCERMAPEAGTWLPMGHYLPHTPALHVTHTICPACKTAMEASESTELGSA